MPNKPTTSAKKLARRKKDEAPATRPSKAASKPIRIQGFSFRFNNDAGQPFVGIADGTKHYILTDASGNHFDRLSHAIELKCLLCGFQRGGCQSCADAPFKKKEGESSGGAKQEDIREPKGEDESEAMPAGEEEERTIKRNASILTFGRGFELNNAPWGEQVVDMAFATMKLPLFVDSNIQVHSMIVNPRGLSTGLLTVRLSDTSGTKLPDGSIVDKFCHLYRKQLSEAGRMGEIPRSLALEVMAFFDEQDSHLADIQIL